MEVVFHPNDFVAQVPRVINKDDEIIVTGFASKGASKFTVTLVDGENGKFNNKEIAVAVTVDITEQIATIGTVRGDHGHTIVNDMRTKNFLAPGMQFTISIVLEEPYQAVCNLNGVYIGTNLYGQSFKSLKYLVVGGDFGKVDTLGFVFAKSSDNRMSSPLSKYWTDFEVLVPRILVSGDQLIITARPMLNFTLALLDGTNGVVNDKEQPLLLDFNFLDRVLTASVIKGGQKINKYETEMPLLVGDDCILVIEPSAYNKSASLTLSIAETLNSKIKLNGTVDLEHGLEQLRFLKIVGNLDYVKSLKLILK